MIASVRYTPTDILIWGKTYPELSWRHREAVCTGGCLRDGTPVRVYPVPLRYLAESARYRLYDWIRVPVAPSTQDARPESYKVRPGDIEITGRAGTAHGWEERRHVIFRNETWHYECLSDLKRRQKEDGSSLGLVPVGAVDSVELKERSDDERRRHERKLTRLRSQSDLFSGEQKDLEFFPWRVRVRWHCERLTGPRACTGHSAQILDWGLGQLGRKAGPNSMKQKMEDLGDLQTYDLRFFVGNMVRYPTTFLVVGVWYPKRRDMQQTTLFHA